MARVYEIDGVVPVVHEGAFVHPDAILIGDVCVGERCYVGPAACLRGDFGRIRLDEGVSLQDTCVVHSFPEMDTILKEACLIGHGAILHGCTIESQALVGMNAVVMDGAAVGRQAIVAAGALVPAGASVPSGCLGAGAPLRVLRRLLPEERRWLQDGVAAYHDLVRRCLTSLRPAEPLRHMPARRKRLACSRELSRTLHDIKRLMSANAADLSRRIGPA
jgi:phenylacetic acid degradation protein